MVKHKQATFYCFSPPVMIATFVVEIALLIGTYLHYKMSVITRLGMTILFFLALFQLSEYFVCGGLGVDAAMWSRIGYVAITTLPPLGLHLIYRLAGLKQRWPVSLSYALGVFWIVLFGLSETAFTGHQCVGNYVIFQLRNGVGGWYFVYYYAMLFWSIAVATRVASRTTKRKVRQSLYGMIAGYLVFLLPTTIVNTLDPSTMHGLPSIMCGFAVLYALILVGYVLPGAAKTKR